MKHITNLLLVFILVLTVDLLSAQQKELPVTDMTIGLSYGIPDFYINGQVDYLNFQYSSSPTHTYFSPYLEITTAKLQAKNYGYGVKAGLQGWKADYLLNWEEVSGNLSGIPFQSSISSFSVDFGASSYLKYGRISLTQSLAAMFGVLTFSFSDAKNKFNDSVVEIGLNGELGLQYQLNKTASVKLAYQKQISMQDVYTFVPEQGLSFTGKHKSPTTLFKIGVNINEDGLTKGYKWLQKKNIL